MKKLNNKKGFTLAELLVVVAIVGILVAISIPVFTSQLSKARKATNQANMRAAKAAAVAQYLTDDEEGAVAYDYILSSGVAEKKNDTSVEGFKEVAIDKASSAKKYTAFRVTVQSATVATDSDGKTTTTTDGASVKIYVKPTDATDDAAN